MPGVGSRVARKLSAGKATRARSPVVTERTSLRTVNVVVLRFKVGRILCPCPPSRSLQRDDIDNTVIGLAIFGTGITFPDSPNSISFTPFKENQSLQVLQWCLPIFTFFGSMLLVLVLLQRVGLASMRC